MDRLTCDLCGNGLLLDGEVRYEVKIDVTCAYDPMELTSEDLARDHASDLKNLVESMKSLSEEDAMDQVHRAFRFDLCGRCQKEYLRNPLRRVP
jgi:hypothetical protein